MRLFLILLLCVVSGPVLAAGTSVKTATAVFAGGCFWSMQIPFDKAPGVIDTVVGFTGGHVPDPSYEQVVQGDTGHFEAVEVTYDPAGTSYDKLLNIFWRNIDPVDADGQFCDRGAQYKTAVFYDGPEEKRQAEESRMLLEADDERFGGKPIVTQILPRAPFYAAQDHHQRYYKKNVLRYNFYRGRCGHDQRLNQIWGKASPRH